ncbi:MAG: response regulator transcription factor [Marmoricola sp.]|nr:response regulator transcription factor [Marmoricola sp.]
MSEAQDAPTRVLVVDDSDQIRELVRHALDRAADFEVVAEASDGEAGVAAAEAHRPGLVLLDIAMPELDGLQALPLIRSAVPDATVVMLSGFSEQDAAITAVENGAHAFIHKGLSVSHLLDQLRDILEMRLERRDQLRGR